MFEPDVDFGGNHRGPAVFLTGGSGVVGQALRRRLSHVDLVCLSHHKPLAAAQAVQGDITRPCLGLTAAKFDDLARRIDYVVHSAAMTSFSQPDKVIRDINVEGTKRVLDLAARANVPFCHISTAFAYTDQHVSMAYRSHAYECSKLEAERVVRESGLPTLILRPSIVIGDSIDGSMSSFQGFHFLMDLIVRGSFPVPGTPQALVDVVPIDLVTTIIASLVERHDVTGEYWITAGDQALTLQRAVLIWFEHWRRLTGRMVKPPRMVEPDIVDRLVRPALLPALPREAQLAIGRALPLVKYVNITKPLPSSLDELGETLGTPRLPDPELTLIRNVEFWVRHVGAEPAAAPTAAAGRV